MAWKPETKLRKFLEKDWTHRCFEAAWKYCFLDIEPIKSQDWLIVHGWVLNQYGNYDKVGLITDGVTEIVDGRPYHSFFSHGWCEFGDAVMDLVSSPKPFSKAEYYKIFDINEKWVRRYTRQEAYAALLKAGRTYGYWDEELFEQGNMSNRKYLEGQLGM